MRSQRRPLQTVIGGAPVGVNVRRPMMFISRALKTVAFISLFGQAAVASDFAIDVSRLSKSTVLYRDQAQISVYPAPVIYLRAAGLSAEGEDSLSTNSEESETGFRSHHPVVSGRTHRAWDHRPLE